VDKHFNHVFSVYLYRHIRFEKRNAGWLHGARLQCLLDNPRLRHVKVLSIRTEVLEADEMRQLGAQAMADPEVVACDVINKSILSIIRKTPLLTNFS